MKKIIIIFSIIILSVFLFFRYAGLVIFWLVTPGDGELRPAEKILLEEIKKESKALDVWREPKYHISNPSDTTTYRIIIRNQESKTIVNKDSLKIEATKISIKINKRLNLHPKFINYLIHYESSGDFGYDEIFKFKRRELPK